MFSFVLIVFCLNKVSVLLLLLSSFSTENECNLYSKYFQNYNLYWVSASRRSHYGRASGGELYGIKTNVKGEFVNHCESKRTYIKLYLTGSVLNIIPNYLNGSHWDEDFSAFSRLIEALSSESLLLMGDLNARIGSAQNWSEDIFLNGANVANGRCSKDAVIDSRGLRLMELCDNHGLIVLNGRTRGDWEGEFTYVSGRGRSAIDLCCASLGILAMIDLFRVIPEVFSDHLPISCSIRTKTDTRTNLGLAPQFCLDLGGAGGTLRKSRKP